jgi:type III pantothenate kinase
MQKALTENTGGLKPGGGKFRDYPDRTADAIYSGAVQAIAGAVERMAALLNSTIGREPECILSGGAARQLHPHLNVSTTVVDNLVLEGLAVISQEILEEQP